MRKLCLGDCLLSRYAIQFYKFGRKSQVGSIVRAHVTLQQCQQPLPRIITRAKLDATSRPRFSRFDCFLRRLTCVERTRSSQHKSIINLILLRYRKRYHKLKTSIFINNTSIKSLNIALYL